MPNEFRVLVSDGMSDVGLAALRAAPYLQVDVKTDLSPAQLLAEIPAYDALLVRSATQVTAEVLRAEAYMLFYEAVTRAAAEPCAAKTTGAVASADVGAGIQ